jgi:two-component system KDP operon response regulator KdpE
VPTTLLLISDDAYLCEALPGALAELGFSVEVARTAVSGLKKAYAMAPDVVLLDDALPEEGSRPTCTRLKDVSGVPLILLMAGSSQDDLVGGLDAGADTCLAKPVCFEELVARIHALLRRVTSSSRERWPPPFSYDGLMIDFARREITLDGHPINLSPIEYRLLALLAQHRGRVLPHNFLLREIWGPEFVNQSNYLRLHISYLRHKLEKDPGRPKLILSEWGVGYRLGV